MIAFHCLLAYGSFSLFYFFKLGISKPIWCADMSRQNVEIKLFQGEDWKKMHYSNFGRIGT